MLVMAYMHTITVAYEAGEEVDDLKGVLHDAHSHQLLAVVAAVHHQ